MLQIVAQAATLSSWLCPLVLLSLSTRSFCGCTAFCSQLQQQAESESTSNAELRGRSRKELEKVPKEAQAALSEAYVERDLAVERGAS